MTGVVAQRAAQYISCTLTTADIVTREAQDRRKRGWCSEG